MSMSSPKYLLGAVEDTIINDGNTFMIYTGAPQNTIRQNTNLFKIEEAFKKMLDHNIDPNNIIVHAPYIINLCSNKEDTRKLGVDFLTLELKRVADMGFNKLVLHPGCKMEFSTEEAIEFIVNGIKMALKNANNNVCILLETMAGKGSEIGSNLNEIQEIITKVDNNKIGVCLDTCHLSDSGIDLTNFEHYLDEFDDKIGITKIKCIHINDSKNEIGSHKDRHENLGQGKIGLENLLRVIYSPRLSNIPKILETPWIKEENKVISPYKKEIEIIKTNKFKTIEKNT